MSSKLTVAFYVFLCLEVGLVLTFLPWVHPFGLGDWGDNYFLLYAARKTGIEGLQHAVSSGWVRGAVTGLGLLNLAIAVWEAAHFRRNVRALEAAASPKSSAAMPVVATANTTDDIQPASGLSDYRGPTRRRDTSEQP